MAEALPALCLIAMPGRRRVTIELCREAERRGFDGIYVPSPTGNMSMCEAPYLVRNDTTPLEAGMCFSDEPGLYIPGEFGIRLEDCWYMTEKGPRLFTPLAKSLEEPI